MGYFSNGSEERDYAARFCDRCHHDAEWQRVSESGTAEEMKAAAPGCPIRALHILHNYKQCDAQNQENGSTEQEVGKAFEGTLSALIPRTKDGLGNERCKMFVESSRVSDEK